MTGPAAHTASTYAADGLRHRSVVGTNTTDVVLDQTMQVRELLNGAVKATFLVGPRGPEYRRDDQAGTIRWYVYDGLGSVVGEVAPDGTLTRAQTFDVYGAVRSSSGTATSKHKFVGSLGHPSDDETGLIYMRARHYDPVCGRFASEDPAGNGPNWLLYCEDNPVNSSDGSGKEAQRSGVSGWIVAFQLYGMFASYALGIGFTYLALAMMRMGRLLEAAAAAALACVAFMVFLGCFQGVFPSSLLDSGFAWGFNAIGFIGGGGMVSLSIIVMMGAQADAASDAAGGLARSAVYGAVGEAIAATAALAAIDSN